MSTSYPYKYEVIIDRVSSVTKRPLVPITAYKGNDEAEARAVFERRKESNDRWHRVRFETRRTFAEAFPQIFGNPLTTPTTKG